MWAIGGSTLNWSTIFFLPRDFKIYSEELICRAFEDEHNNVWRIRRQRTFSNVQPYEPFLQVGSIQIQTFNAEVYNTHLFLKILSINLLNHVVSGPMLSTHSTPRKSKILQKLHLSYMCNLIQN